MSKAYRRYDHRLKHLVVDSGDIQRFVHMGIPVSTLRQWLKNGLNEVFTIPELEFNSTELAQKIFACSRNWMLKLQNMNLS